MPVRGSLRKFASPGHLPESGKQHCVCRNAVTRPDRSASARTIRPARAHPSRPFRSSRPDTLPGFGAPASVVHDDGPGGFDHDPQHRPQIRERAQETGNPKLGEIDVGIGMVEAELAAIVVGSLLLQQPSRPRMVKLSVVEHDEPWIANEMPTCNRGTAHCRVDTPPDGRLAQMFPDEVVCAEGGRLRVVRANGSGGRPRKIDLVGRSGRPGNSSTLYRAMPELTGPQCRTKRLSPNNFALPPRRGARLAVPGRYQPRDAGLAPSGTAACPPAAAFAPEATLLRRRRLPGRGRKSLRLRGGSA